MAYQPDLYRSVASSDGLGAKVLIPNGTDTQGKTNVSNGNTQNTSIDSTATTVDIHKNYSWTLSPLAARQYVPVIEITEYKQVLSSELVALAYNLRGNIDNVRVAAATLPTTLRAAGSVAGTTVSSIAGSFGILAAGIKIGTGIADAGATAGNWVKDNLNLNFTKNEAAQESKKDSIESKDSSLDPYIGLYAIEPTNWAYRMPYFHKDNFAQTNAWGAPGKDVQNDLNKAFSGGGKAKEEGGDESSDADESGKTGSGLGLMSRLAAFSKAAIGATGGASTIEIPQAYKGPGPAETDTITVKFQLYNTVNYADIKKNWEFCYLFSYQNLPNRKGINLLDPPCLYKVTIPGYRQFPMCMVTSLKITNLGSVRLIDIVADTLATESNRGPNIKLIPEAYDIEIIFKHAFFSSRNLFAFAENPDGVVSVTTVPAKVDDAKTEQVIAPKTYPPNYMNLGGP